MNRCFFTDPLAAAWMAKHHGFTLYVGDIEADDIDAYSAHNSHHVVDDWGYRRRPGCQLLPIDRIYVHPSSMHLLEPDLGDVCDYDGEFPGSTIWQMHDHSEPAEVFKSIIQRNGVPFHWPESEAA
jgi:hypothetical protein